MTQETDHSTPAILIVEDSPTQLLALKTQIEGAGYRTICADSGRAALACLKTGKDVCLVISDWIMPEIDGFDLLIRVRDNPAFHDVPFLMVTSKDSTEDAVLALRTGANDFIRKPYHPEELLARVKNLVANWYLQRQLEREASLDELTGLTNSRSGKTILQAEIDRVKRYGGELAIIVFDIDQFKKFNDAFGHRTGDLILENLGVLIRGNIRAVDYPCRSEGGEFTVILPCTNLPGGLVVAERLHRRIADHLFGKHKNKNLKISCSFGLADLAPEDDTMESFLDKARKAMYQSKKSGGGRITTAS